MILFLFFLILVSSSFQTNKAENQLIYNNSTKVPIEAHKSEENNFSDKSVLKLYEISVQSYLDNDWESCIEGFHDLIYKYKNYKSAITNCRQSCHDEVETFVPISRENIEDLHFYEKKIRETLCILKCNEKYRQTKGKHATKKIPQKIKWNMESAAHYEYLHNCYYQSGRYQDAANAVFTYLVYHPDHKPSKSSLLYYMGLPEVRNSSIHNLESEPFVNDYMQGIQAYDIKNYKEAIIRLESSLKSYMESEEQCRFYCEDPLEQTWNPDFTVALSNHFVYNLHCKRRCSRLLNTINGEYRKDLFVNHFHYMQFIYYKLGDIKKACESVANYLLFYPADDTMLSNAEYYATLPSVQSDYFKPQDDVLAYLKRQEYEKLLLLYVKEEFNHIHDNTVSANPSTDNNIEGA